MHCMLFTVFVFVSGPGLRLLHCVGIVRDLRSLGQVLIITLIYVVGFFIVIALFVFIYLFIYLVNDAPLGWAIIIF